MSQSIPVAYLSQSKIHLPGPNGNGTRTLDSAFGKSLRDRAAQIQNRHAWKTQGRGAQFMSGMLWGSNGAGHDPGEFRIAMTSVCRGRESGELLYALETDEVAGIFGVNADGHEQRLFHTADFRIRHISLAGDGNSVAAAVFHNFVSNIAVLSIDGTEFQEVTEGDSLDLAPHWIPGCHRELVFQTAGVGRDSAGRFSGVGPFGVHRLNLTSGAMDIVVEDAKFDYLGPQMTGDGTLYAIRRPYQEALRSATPLTMLKDTAMFPFRLAFAVFQFFNFFSMKYTGNPLANSNGAVQKQPDLKQMMIWGNLVDADRAAKESAANGDKDAPNMVPSSWELIRMEPHGEPETIAKGVLSFDLAPDGSVLYSNGSAIQRVKPGASKSERLLTAKFIEQVIAI